MKEKFIVSLRVLLLFSELKERLVSVVIKTEEGVHVYGRLEVCTIIS